MAEKIWRQTDLVIQFAAVEQGMLLPKSRDLMFSPVGEQHIEQLTEAARGLLSLTLENTHHFDQQSVDRVSGSFGWASASLGRVGSDFFFIHVR